MNIEYTPQSPTLKEIEIKYQVEESFAIALEENLIKEGFVFVGEINEKDLYFDGPEYISLKICLRIRSKNNKHVLTYKGPTTNENSKEGVVAKEEVDVVVSDYDSAVKLIESLGHPKLVEVSKHRKEFEAQINDEKVTIAIDRVETAGIFIEIEVISKSEPIARSLIKEVSTKLGFDNQNQVVSPYRDIVLNLRD